MMNTMGAAVNAPQDRFGLGSGSKTLSPETFKAIRRQLGALNVFVAEALPEGRRVSWPLGAVLVVPELLDQGGYVFLHIRQAVALFLEVVG